MLTHGALPEIIPVFPLNGAVVLPRSRLPLHVFEPRYLQMLEDVLKTPERLIGMVQPADEEGALQQIGCVGRVTQFSETEDGRYLITLTGISRFRVAEEVEGFTPYRRCRVDWGDFTGDQSTGQDARFRREPFLDLLRRYFDHGGLSADWDSLKDAEVELLVNSLSMMLDFEPEDKQALLEAPSLTARRETLEALMEFALRGGMSDEVMQ